MKKKLLTPVLIAAGSIALGIGSTFALFSSNESSKAELEAGVVKVNFENTVTKALSRYNDDTPYDAIAHAGDGNMAVFENGGTASIVSTTGDSTKLVLDRISPMDMISFKASATNASNINIKFRYFVKLEGELLPGLQVTIDGTEYATPTNGKTIYSLWSQSMTPDVESLFVKDVSVYFPYEASVGVDQNSFQGKQCSIEIGIEAIQGNATVVDEISEDVSPTTETIHSPDPTGENKTVVMPSSNGEWAAIVGGGAVDNNPETELSYTFSLREEPAAVIGTGTECESYDVSFTGIKEGNTEPIIITRRIGPGKENVKVYHDGVLIPSQYDEVTGYVTFNVTNFSPFDFVWDAPRETSYGFYDSYKVDEGLATEHWVHEISNPTEFRNMWMDKYYQENEVHYPGYLEAETVYCLINNVDFNGESTYGSNFDTWQSYAFTGIFDGQEYTLKGITNNETYKDVDRIGGMFSNLGRPVEIKNLVLDEIHLVHKTSDKGIGIISGGLEVSTASTLVLSNIETTSLCSIESCEKTGGFIGCCRGYQSVTITDCVNGASIVSTGKNSGGFLGSSSSTKEFYFTNCVSKGTIISTNSDGFVSGFVSQSQSATTTKFVNCTYEADVDNRSGGQRVSFFAPHTAGTVTYENCVVDGMITVKDISFVNEIGKTGITAKEGTLNDHVNVVNCEKISMEFDETKSLVVTPIANADHYEVSLNFSCLKGPVNGDTFVQTNDSDFVYNCGSYADAEALKDVKLITRVGHVLDNAVTKFDTHYASQGVSSNHYRLSELGSYSSDTPTKQEGVDGWYVVFGNEGDVKFINFYETVWLTYNIIAKDSSGVVIGSSSWKVGGYSASPFMNMAGEWYRGSAPHYTPIIL